MWEKIMSVLKSKKFWTLVTAIVAALAAYFTVSCAAQARVQREGVHIDTVRVDYIIKSRNIQTLSSCLKNQNFGLKLIVPTSMPMISSWISSRCAMVGPKSEAFCSSIFSTPFVLDSMKSLMLYPISKFPSIITGNCFSENVRTIFSSNSLAKPSGNSCSAISMIANLSFLGLSLPRSSARRGRGGKRRPKSTKSVPLGGSHL